MLRPEHVRATQKTSSDTRTTEARFPTTSHDEPPSHLPQIHLQLAKDPGNTHRQLRKAALEMIQKLQFLVVGINPRFLVYRNRALYRTHHAESEATPRIVFARQIQRHPAKFVVRVVDDMDGLAAQFLVRTKIPAQHVVGAAGTAHVIPGGDGVLVPEVDHVVPAHDMMIMAQVALEGVVIIAAGAREGGVFTLHCGALLDVENHTEHGGDGHVCADGGTRRYVIMSMSSSFIELRSSVPPTTEYRGRIVPPTPTSSDHT